MKTLEQFLPEELHYEYQDTTAFKLKDVEVIEEKAFGWPGKHKHVTVWYVLKNGKAVGWNENPGRGWSFPVIDFNKLNRKS